MSAAFTSYGLRTIAGASLDPILNVDDFRMSEPTFPPHPHAGFSAVTYLFEDSKGSFVNRDSLGDRSVIGPGALHWTQAGRGMMHEEIPSVAGLECHGIQMFVNLRRAHKDAAPRAFHVEAQDVPEVRGDGARVRVLAGELDGHRSTLTELLTPIVFLDVHLEPSATLRVPLPRGHNGVVLAIAGSGLVGADADHRALPEHAAAAFADDGDEVALSAGSTGLEVLVLAGAPIGEPVIFGGPFAMTSRAEIQDAFARHARGEMGHLEPSFRARR
ncbi:MAG: pirin family protein [Deltaproteobacteria bacterium]|nr:pirin family protein [Deltaproteobacteria bacterium]